MKRGTVCPIFKSKVLRKPVIEKMKISSTLSREAAMIFSSITEPLNRSPKILCNGENFSGFRLARKEHNASFILPIRLLPTAASSPLFNVNVNVNDNLYLGHNNEASCGKYSDYSNTYKEKGVFFL